MNRLLLLFCPLAALFALPAAAQLNQPPKGFTALFNGKDLSGWWGLKTEDPRKWMALDEEGLKKKRDASIVDINKHWSVDNGVLVNDGHGLYLSTLENYGDFEFRVDYKTVPKADSGIYLKGIPQVQIWDSTDKGKFKLGADKGSGGLWNNPKDWGGKDPLVLADKPFGEWNAFRIRMLGERVTVYLNDKLVVDHARLKNFYAKKGPYLPVPRVGPIELQTHGGEIRWRNVFIREFGADEANQLLAEKGEEGFESVFNGTDFTGWKGPVDNYEIVDGTIRCKAGKGGTIFTENSYADHVIRFEFKLPPGGNNGLAIRYPGSGNTAYVGMCELQVLDSEHQKFAKLDPRQYHGSAYGMAAAHRGYLREAGEWNFQEVSVIGSTIKVELNGTVILDSDLSKIDPAGFMGKSKHPGLSRTEGHFGFAGHNDPVSFRNIRIKKL